LLQLNQEKKAIDFIKKNRAVEKSWEHTLANQITDPIIQAILQGKLNQANELGINMAVHPDSQLSYPFSEGEQDVLLTTLGNLIENAMEAVKSKPSEKRKIAIFLTDIGEDVVIEVDDSGPGIRKKDLPQIFEPGFTTKKGEKRGIGLALSYQAIQRIGGEIILEEGDLGGACFVMIIPKREQ
jgi:two-component system CitB family sensor kinase/CitB family two-component system sensor histidine kinase CitS